MGDYVTIQTEKIEQMGKGTLLLSPLAKALRAYSKEGWGNKGYKEVADELNKIYKKPLHEVTTVDEFLCPKLIKALTQLENKTMAENICGLVRLFGEGQFSTGYYRRSYHSKDFGYYSEVAVQRIRDWIRAYHTNYTIQEMLVKDHSIRGYEEIVALELNRRNPYFEETIREMIEGENNVLLSRNVIIGIIKSDRQDFKDLLLKLLVAAGPQEGLRQAILESADAGSFETFKSIYQCCMDKDLFRFSSASRALFTWAGLYIDKLELPTIRKYAKIGWDCLNDPSYRETCLNSKNPYEMYFAMWSMGCQEVADTDKMATKLIESEETFRKYVGWYFIYRIPSESLKHRYAVKHLEEEEIGILAAVTDCIHYNAAVCSTYGYRKTGLEARAFPDPLYPEDVRDRRELFAKLKKIALRIGHEEVRIKGYIFPWSELVINQENARVMRAMLSLAAYDLDEQMIDELFELQDLMVPDLRFSFYIYLLDPDKKEKHRRYLWEGLKDKSIDNKLIAVEKLQACKTTKEDVVKICDMLVSKSAKIKKAAVNYLMPLEKEHRQEAIDYLLGGKENFQQVALELMIADQELAEKNRPRVEELQKNQSKKLSDQTILLLDQLQIAKKEESEELLYGLIDSQAVKACLSRLKDQYPMTLFTEKEILALYPKKKELDLLVKNLVNVFVRHADFEYEVEDYDGTHRKILFGDAEDNYGFSRLYFPAEYGCDIVLRNNGQGKLHMIPFAEEFREVLADYSKDPAKLGMAVYVLRMIDNKKFEDWFKPFAEKYQSYLKAIYRAEYKGIFDKVLSILTLALGEVDQNALYTHLSKLYFSLCHQLGEDKLSEIAANTYTQTVALDTYLFYEIRNIMRRLEPDEDAFTKHFANMYLLERGSDYVAGDHLAPEDYLRAVSLGLLSENELFDWVLHSNADSRSRGIFILSSLKYPAYKEYLENYPWIENASKTFIDAVVRFEAKRGQAETPITRKIRYLARIEGGEYFCLLLKALGKDSFFRGYSWSMDGTKSASLSSLLKKCWPTEADTPEALAKLIKETKLTEKRLVEAAMYAPQWAAHVEYITGWKGLKKAIWFFHAHISESFSSEKETEVAIYSPITPQEFNDGAFDISWFEESVEEMGEARFKQLYNFAKYITNGSNAHRRSQLYTDACLGKFDVNVLEAEILEKRNQEKLRAYALTPVTEEDLLRRYEFIQKYIKDSRQFGAQRRESEKKAGLTAIRNLAIASGYMDVNRMLWRLENTKNKEILPLLTPQTVEGYEISLTIDEAGNPDLRIEKAGKVLKTPPKAIAKHDMILDLKQTVKELKDQKSRGKQTLEDSMINRIEFGVSEFEDVLTSLTIAPMAKALIWKSGDLMGYPVSLGSLADDGAEALATASAGEFLDGAELRHESGAASRFALRDYAGNLVALPETAAISIAHPHHLFESGHWSDYMHDAFTRQLVQPFKQIFREYYPMTEEEKQEKTLSRRYAGYQVQPKKTVALLKGRGWTVDYEEGLQKVCYGDNLIVRMYAMADWFSPADIEAPTLEVVRFYDRKTGNSVSMEDINPVLFSEVMRDLDLVVSVAYVGGVEIETSHSTVQMRISLAKELILLMKLKNVTFTDHHARIEGKLATYSVHMGSGIVHAGAKGMIPILPVHSQHRGRIFLPFADEDPRTAEIMSKIILLSEDQKIKDPEILRMLR